MPDKKKRLVMGFGTFDHFHPGHAFYLRELGKLGGRLIVVVARDRNVEKVKALQTTHSEEERLVAVKNSGLADEVVLGNQEDIYQVLRDYQPDVVGLGYDQRANEDKIREVLPDVEIVRIGSFKPERHKSSHYRAAPGGAS